MGIIPDDAKKVFNGVIFDVYQWPQKMFDGTTETFEMLRRPDTVVIIAVDKNQNVILVDEEQPNHKKGLGLPAGRHDKDGEDELAGAKRELLEETGYTTDKWNLIYTISPQPKIEWQIHYYLALDCEKTSKQTLDNGEKIEVVILDLDKFMQKALKQEIPLWDLDRLFLRARLDSEAWSQLRDYMSGEKDKLPDGLI